MIAMKITDKTGPICGTLVVSEEDEIMCMTSTGQSVRIPAAEIRVIGRATQGVKIMSLKKGETIQDIARVVEGEETDEEEGDEAAGSEGTAEAAKPEAAEAAAKPEESSEEE